MNLVITLTDDSGERMMMRADMISAVTSRPPEQREAAFKQGVILKGGNLWAMGRIIHGMQESVPEVINVMRKMESALLPVDQLSLVLHDHSNGPVYIRPGHIAAITGIPVNAKLQARKAGKTLTGSVLWCVSGHAILVRETQPQVLASMQAIAKDGCMGRVETESSLVTFGPKTGGTTGNGTPGQQSH